MRSASPHAVHVCLGTQNEWLAIIVAAYAVSPIDLIPDFVPVARNTFTCIRHMTLKLDLRSKSSDRPQNCTRRPSPARYDVRAHCFHCASMMLSCLLRIRPRSAPLLR